jgi:hypothetical protein
LDAKYFPKAAVAAEKTPETSSKLSLDESKKINTLTFDEAKVLAMKVFGAGPATDLLITMSKNSPAMIQRVIALGKHE